MKNESGSRRRVARWPLALASVVALGALVPAPASAQVPARFYWKSLSGANAVPLIFNSISGNTNPFDPSHQVTPGGNVDATLALFGYGHTFSLGGRAASQGERARVAGQGQRGVHVRPRAHLVGGVERVRVAAERIDDERDGVRPRQGLPVEARGHLGRRHRRAERAQGDGRRQGERPPRDPSHRTVLVVHDLGSFAKLR